MHLYIWQQRKRRIVFQLGKKVHTFPLLPSYLFSHICNLRSAKQVSRQAVISPPSTVGALRGVPGSFVVASNSTCSPKLQY